MSVHDGHRSRMREEFLSRPEAAPDHKLLELLLFYANPRGDTNPTAHILMDRFGSLTGVLDAPLVELRKVPGVGEQAVALLKAVKETASRYYVARTRMDEIILTSEDMFRALLPYFFGARDEKVCVLCMDGKGKSLGVRTVMEGSVNSVSITSRKVVEAALSLNATQAVLAHNHVSGLALPSFEDRRTTDRLARILYNVGVSLEDHLVFSDDDMVSLRESGLYHPEKIAEEVEKEARDAEL